MAVNRYYSSTAVDTTLAVGISASATSMTVSSVTGFPTSYPYTQAVDYDTSLEELVNVVGASGTTLTLGTTVGVADITGRGVDQGAGYRVAHAAGAVVKHIISGRDVREPQEHIAATTSVHGIADTSALVTASSTTILTNKSLTAPTITGTADVTAGTLAFGTTGSITANSTTLSATELGYLDGATSNLQTQITNLGTTKANLSGATFTGSVTIPSGTINASTIATPYGGTISVASGGTFAVGAAGQVTSNGATVSAASLGYVSGATSNIQDQITGKLTIPGSWTTTWVPTWSGTGSSATGATVSTAYSQVGKTVSFRINITYGTGNFGSAGAGVSFSTPSGLTPIANTTGQCVSITGAGNRYGGEVVISSTGTITPLATPATAGGASQLLTSSTPFSWGTTSQLIISGTYEVA